MKKHVLLAAFIGIGVAAFAQTNMTLEGTQTITGNKTFLNGSLRFRNVANTFNSSFTNTNTAARTYTLPNTSGTIALTSNLTWATITGKPTTIAGYGITNFNSLGDARWLKLSGTNTLTANFLLAGLNSENFAISSGDGVEIESFLEINPESVSINSTDLSAGGGVSLDITPTGGIYAETQPTKYGIRYGASGYVTSARSLTDKGYVDVNLLGLPLSAPVTADAGKSIRWNAAGTAWEYFTPGGGGAFIGTSGQIPFANPTNDGLISSDGLIFLSATKQFITGDNNTAPNGTNTFTSGENNVNKGRFGSAMFGELSEIETNVGAAIAGGEGVYIAAYGGHAMGRGTSIRAGAFYSYSGGWWEPGTTLGKTNFKVPQVSGTSSFGYYSTDPNQVDNHGVRANSSAILGGKNSDIPPGSNYSVVLGGQEIKARANDPSQVYVPNFNIVTAPAIDNALTQVIVRDGTTGQIKYRDSNTLGVWTTAGATINYTGGNVGIGTALATNPNGYKLAVNGKIGAKDVQVENSSGTWPDYVFNSTYQLPSLQSVEKFIQENKHLENVPSAEEVERNGHSLGEMDKILLKKVEELTLYIIQQQKEIEELKKKIEDK